MYFKLNIPGTFLYTVAFLIKKYYVRSKNTVVRVSKAYYKYFKQ